MPSLIRLLVALLFLGGLVYAGLFALGAMVDPGEKDITVRIPARDLVVRPAQTAPSPDGTFDLGAPARNERPTRSNPETQAPAPE